MIVVRCLLLNLLWVDYQPTGVAFVVREYVKGVEIRCRSFIRGRLELRNHFLFIQYRCRWRMGAES